MKGRLQSKFVLDQSLSFRQGCLLAKVANFYRTVGVHTKNGVEFRQQTKSDNRTGVLRHATSCDVASIGFGITNDCGGFVGQTDQ